MKFMTKRGKTLMTLQTGRVDGNTVRFVKKPTIWDILGEIHEIHEIS